MLSLLTWSAPAAAQVRIEMLEGRAQLVTAARVEQLVEHAAPFSSDASGHLTVRSASRLRLTWPGRASVLVQGPAALEWSVDGGAPGAGETRRQASASETIELAVVELGQLDVEVRRGVLQLSLPESWRASLSGVAVHLAALPSGAVELVHHAGPPVVLEWTGERSASRPPIRVPAGSSVRLARPRHSPQEPPAEARRAPWPADADAWPWRAPSDTPALRAARLAQPRRTDRPEGWSSGVDGPGRGQWVSHVETFDAAGRARLVPVSTEPGASVGPTPSASPAPNAAPVLSAAPTASAAPGRGAAGDAALARAARRVRERTARVTSAQASAAQAQPKVTVQPSAPVELGVASDPGEGNGMDAAPAPTPAQPLPELEEPVDSPDAQSTTVPAANEPDTSGGDARTAAPSEPALSPPLPGFDPAEWRGTARARLQGVGPIAVQRAPGVELRALSAGRVRVLVDGSVSGPVWCFAPGRDLRLAPGATVVFEADGAERMRLGAIETFTSSPERPRWDALGSW